MTSIKNLFVLTILILGGAVLADKDVSAADVTTAMTEYKLDPENTLFVDLEYGRVVIRMRPDLAPNHIDRIKELARSGFYDGLLFHRVIEGFMAQTGDPDGNGTGGSGQNLAAEFNEGKFVRGSVGMARSASLNSADSQFFIVFEESSHLNGQYTYWGQVMFGMDYVDEIRRGNPARGGTVSYPDRMIQVQVAADVDEADWEWEY